MSKTSKRAILTIIVIATLLTVMIPIMPASAETVEFIEYEADGFADWTFDTSRSGIYSVKLDSAGPGAGRIRILIDPIPLSTLEDPSFWTYEPTVTNDGGYDMATKEAVPPGYFPWGHAYINILLDTDGSGVFGVWDDKMEGLGSSAGGATTGGGIVAVPPDASTWTEMQEAWGFYDMEDSMGTGFYGFGAGPGNEIIIGTLAEWKAAMPIADVMGIEITFGWTPYDIGPVYVDDVTIGGETYTLEDVLPEQPDFSIDYITPGDVDYGDVLTVIGSGVTAGSEIIVYWDYATGTLIHPLNTTEGNPDGSYDLEVKVPSDLVGDHWLWVKDVATGATVKSDTLTMIPKIKLSPSSGLKNDDVDIKGYGFAAESEIDITFAPAILSEDGGVDVVETDELGYFEYTFEVDTDVDDTYTVTAEDEDANDDSAEFILGASISIDPVEGPTGTVVTVEGRGWINTETITFFEETSGMPIKVVDLEVIKVGTNGRFSAEVVIPEFGNEGDYDIEAVGTSTPDPSSDAFELLGLPEIVVTPTYGTPGKIITVKGYNFTQIADTEVTINLDGEELVIAETNSDGTFEDTFISPAVVFTTYDVEATDDYGLFATDPFKVGLIALIINPVYGEAGTELSITGIGFASSGEYNVTFGTILYEEYGSGVSGGEAISDIFYVPNVLTGIYDITITDEDDNAMTVEFRVTAVTEVTLDPAMAPNKYNVTVEGINFADYEDTVEFVLYNATDEWDMDVKQMWDHDDNSATDNVERDAETCDDGNFTAYWFVLDDDDLSLGDYTINVTGYDDFLIQIPFNVVEARVSVAPRKPLFDRGDTIQFDVNNDFDFDESYMKIWDPDDNLYWQTELFEDWVKSGDLYTVPYYLQTSGLNPMELSQDAPEGTWFYVFYETGKTQLTNGTFEVGPSAESLLTEQIAALSEELGIDIDTLRTVIDDLGIDMDDAVSSMAEQIATAVSSMEDDLDDAVTGMQDDISDLSDDIDGMGNKMDSIETMVDDISGTSTAAQEAANEAAASADAALEASEQTQRQTSGLQGLVYGAIGASLIAALAAIVSLMQISRRIAG